MRLIIVVLFVISIRSIHSAISSKPTARQIDVLRNTFKELLDFPYLPRPGEVIRPVSRTANAASKYMRKLFEQYRRGGNRNLGHSEGNIVRSISPVVDQRNDDDVLIFKLYKISPEERVIRAELHYNIRGKQSKMHRKRRRPPVTVHPIGVNRTKNLNAINLSGNYAAWLSWDAREVVIQSTRKKVGNEQNRNDTLPELVVKFVRGDRAMDGVRLLRIHTPFLLVFTNAPIIVNRKNVQSALYSVENSDQLSNIHLRSRRDAGYYTYSSRKDHFEDHKERQQFQMRVRAFTGSGPELLRSRTEIRRTRRRKKHRNKSRSSQKGELPPSKKYGEFGSFDKELEEEKDRESDGNNEEVTVVLLGGNRLGGEKCAKRDLSVQFRDIGWEHWIIAPKAFDAHYCSGSCPFPLDSVSLLGEIIMSEEVNPSNHAIVQSIIHAIGLNPFVPQVGCAPDRMDSLTLLYFDEDDNVVLKNYPKMTVSSCGCL